jgi:hypothetical protein
MEGRCVKVEFGCKQRSLESQKWPVLHWEEPDKNIQARLKAKLNKV